MAEESQAGGVGGSSEAFSRFAVCGAGRRVASRMIVRYGEGVPVVPQDEAEYVTYRQHGRIRAAVSYGQHLADS